MKTTSMNRLFEASSRANNFLVLASSILLLIGFASLLMAQSNSSTPESLLPELPKTFTQQMTDICDEITSLMAKDPLLKDMPQFKLGRFVSMESTEVNFELRIIHEFELRLSKFIVAKNTPGVKTLKGTYELRAVPSPNQGKNTNPLQVIVLSVSITNPNGVELGSITREVDDSADIATMAGVTIAFKSNDSPSDRHKLVSQAIVKPGFGLAAGSKTRITCLDDERYAVEIRKSKANSKALRIPVVPESKDGMAFVSIDLGEEYEIGVYSYQEGKPVIARVRIDGLDAINRFNEDKVKYEGYVVPPMNGEPGLAVVPGWLRTATTNQNSAFRFLVDKLGDGAADERRAAGGTGVITVEIYESGPVERGVGDKIGTVAGDAINVEFKINKQIIPAFRPSAIIAIRYVEVAGKSQ